jgi:hypothetical protein
MEKGVPPINELHAFGAALDPFNFTPDRGSGLKGAKPKVTLNKAISPRFLIRNFLK